MAVLLSNNATGRLGGSINATQTSISLKSGDGAKFPAPGAGDWFPLTVVNARGDLEIMRCTARNGDNLTVVRRQEGTIGLAFSAGDRAELRLTQSAIEDISVRKGMITLWSGSIATIPTGWALCNGANGTPDLRDRFVVGAGSTYAVGAKGGNKDAIVPAHTHTASTNSAGSHSHTGTANSSGSHSHGITNSSNRGRFSSWSDTNGGRAIDGTYDYNKITVSTVSSGAHTHSLSIVSGGEHSHTVTVNSTGVSVTNANLPPYYALAYIMKL